MKLIEWRKSQERTQKQVADLLGVSQARVSEMESGTVPSSALIQKIADATGWQVPPDVWFERPAARAAA